MNATDLQRELTSFAPLLARLKDCAQEPDWHAEGDVATHTEMVRVALEAIPAFQALPSEDQNDLRLAAALHDVGKPDTTRMEDGILRSPGHGRRGAEIVRHHWWTEGYRLSQIQRERIATLVRYHGRPIHSRTSLEAHAIATSAVVNCRLLSILAEADMRGRTCPAGDLDEAVLKIELFREAARDMGCLDQPFAWSNPHARFKFFAGGAHDRFHQAHNDRTFVVHLLVGLPGAGKSSFTTAQQLPVVSRDDLREAASLDPSDRSDQGRAHQLFQEALKVRLRAKEECIVDGTNLIKDLRQKTIGLCVKYGAEVHLHVFDRDRKAILRQNLDREAVVPEFVIDKMARHAEWPDETEAHFVVRHQSLTNGPMD